MATAVHNGGGGLAGRAALGATRLNGAHDAVRVDIAVGHLAEDDVLAIEPGGDDGGDEELGAVAAGVRGALKSDESLRDGSSIGHGQEERLVVLQLEVLVGELLAVDGAATGALDGQRDRQRRCHVRCDG
jgi:hypothetical protein